ncbi:hypothetical protein KO528_00460 [Saccharophagus degradans]|uniref:hypothetical protein n=1 Tax=Saccharophagus degradans TaxID=86304 RepID=UPI001C0855C1|nr:hypothetical protein [Saccharophagus degradans]MBU2983807.1 hypothetical protein [Saccharophagus degradans]
MQEQSNYQFLLLFIVIAVIAFFVGRHKAKLRTQALTEKARSLGMQFSHPPRVETTQRFNNFALFDRGRSQSFLNELWRKDINEEVCVFGYRYVTGSGKNSTTHMQTVFAVTNKQLNLPNFALSPENFFHKIGQVFGYSDIDFDNHPSFSKSYLLRGSNEAQIRQLFNRNVIQYFEKHAKLSVEGQGDTLLIYKQRSRVEPHELQQFIQNCTLLYKLMLTQ